MLRKIEAVAQANLDFTIAHQNKIIRSAVERLGVGFAIELLVCEALSARSKWARIRLSELTTRVEETADLF
ncbi:hypothetical protein A2872_03120 [Candidatus Gottesmanbacteria bacterium RIFCSPHIGHO2_01_FULL_42_12]|uniref:Uncharacterized protein n=1 Tax=Candidatus Gottesmanbacteria bacterium RIFCSPHIGHO2_01_FULL_42_12 TaxID=1798377 RepID=A0A1F5Z131_9BACT|nr:MAG: hypothetical protein A2872_03120 [Candidatus Gottesmanbacteria bacterium RIFCSPHIGHO2_01_FULL_42_12]